jgi:2-polyprenyl-3-methyl-5-hydroxy-6-metoxy-1,4-benzoquinol methylase
MEDCVVTENEIRPKEIFDKYLELSKKDGAKLDPTKFATISCPACKSTRPARDLEKFGFSFDRCGECGTLFCNPRPTASQLKEFYVHSESAAFWSKEFLPKVEAARKEKLVKPKVREIVKFLQERRRAPKRICDIGAGHGFVLEELAKDLPEATYYAIEPDANSCAVLRSKNFLVTQGLLGESDSWAGTIDFATCFEVFEHVFSPETFVRDTFDLLAPGGLVLFTTLSCDGYDIATLRETSKAISPPHHLNFFSHQGFRTLLEKVGFSRVEIATPGKLDVDIVLNSGSRNDFLEVLRKRGPEAVAAFQEFLATNNLSSHTWIWAQK